MAERDPTARQLRRCYKGAGEAFDAVSALGAELVLHESSFLEATDAQFEAAVSTELAASMDASAGARSLHKLALCRSAVAALRDTRTRVKRIFWLANHTTGCNWSTVAQLKFREEHDANAVVSDQHFTPWATWEDQVKGRHHRRQAREGRPHRGRQARPSSGQSLPVCSICTFRAAIGAAAPAVAPAADATEVGRGGGSSPGGPVGSQGGGYGPPCSPFGAWWYRWGGGGGRGGKQRRTHNCNKENVASRQNNARTMAVRGALLVASMARARRMSKLADFSPLREDPGLELGLMWAQGFSSARELCSLGTRGSELGPGDVWLVPTLFFYRRHPRCGLFTSLSRRVSCLCGRWGRDTGWLVIIRPFFELCV